MVVEMEFSRRIKSFLFMLIFVGLVFGSVGGVLGEAVDVTDDGVSVAKVIKLNDAIDLNLVVSGLNGLSANFDSGTGLLKMGDRELLDVNDFPAGVSKVIFSKDDAGVVFAKYEYADGGYAELAQGRFGIDGRLKGVNDKYPDIGVTLGDGNTIKVSAEGKIETWGEASLDIGGRTFSTVEIGKEKTKYGFVEILGEDVFKIKGKIESTDLNMEFPEEVTLCFKVEECPEVEGNYLKVVKDGERIMFSGDFSAMSKDDLEGVRVVIPNADLDADFEGINLGENGRISNLDRQGNLIFELVATSEGVQTMVPTSTIVSVPSVTSQNPVRYCGSRGCRIYGYSRFTAGATVPFIPGRPLHNIRGFFVNRRPLLRAATGVGRVVGWAGRGVVRVGGAVVRGAGAVLRGAGRIATAPVRWLFGGRYRRTCYGGRCYSRGYR